MTTLEPPLPNLLGFIADEDKEFLASLARSWHPRLRHGPRPSAVGGRRALAHVSGTTERFAWP